MVLADPYREYRRTQIITSPPERLVDMMYDGVLRAIDRARLSANQEAWPSFRENLFKAQSIVDELLMSIDLENGGEVSQNLQSLYLWVRGSLVQASVKCDMDQVESAAKVINQLREAWAEACLPQAREKDPVAQTE